MDDNELSYDTMDDGAHNTAEDIASSDPSIKEMDHDNIPAIDPSTLEEPDEIVTDTTTSEEDHVSTEVDHENTGVDDKCPPVDDTIESTGVGEEPHDAVSIDLSMEGDNTEEADYHRAEQLGIKSAQDDGAPLPKCTCKKKADEMYE